MTLSELSDDLLALVLQSVEWKEGLQASRLVCRRWRALHTREWFLRWRDQRKRLSESAQRELLRQLGNSDSLAAEDRRGATAMLGAAAISVLVDDAQCQSSPRDRFLLPGPDEFDVERHATGWELGRDAQVIVSWNATLYSTDECEYFEDYGDESSNLSYTEVVRPNVFVVRRGQGASGSVVEYCQVEQYFNGEWGDHIQDECKATGPAAREFRDIVAGYVPEAAEMSPSVLLALTICSSRMKLCSSIDEDAMLKKHAYDWTARRLSNMVRPAMACKMFAGPSSAYLSSLTFDDAALLQANPRWFASFASPPTEDINQERLSVAKWIRSIQNRPSVEAGGEANDEQEDEDDDETIPCPWLK